MTCSRKKLLEIAEFEFKFSILLSTFGLVMTNWLREILELGDYIHLKKESSPRRIHFKWNKENSIQNLSDEWGRVLPMIL